MVDAEVFIFSEAMNDTEVIQKFKDTGALLEGHFLLSSGLHSSVYLQCAIALQNTKDATEFGAAIAAHFKQDSIDTVASPAIGGLVIGYEVARRLGVRFIWTERESGRMTLRRGFTVKEGERVLVVEDVAAASIIDRSGGQADVGVPRFSLATLSVPALSPESCEACRRGDVAIKPGSRSLSSGA